MGHSVGDREHGDGWRPRRARRLRQGLFVDEAVPSRRHHRHRLAEGHRLADSCRWGIEQRPGLLRPWGVVAPIGEVRLQHDVAGTEQPGDGRQGRGLIGALLQCEVEGLEEIGRRVRALDGLLTHDLGSRHDAGPDRVEHGAPVVGGEVLPRFDERPRGIALGVEVMGGLGVVGGDLLRPLEVDCDGTSLEVGSAVGDHHRRQRASQASPVRGNRDQRAVAPMPSSTANPSTTSGVARSLDRRASPTDEPDMNALRPCPMIDGSAKGWIPTASTTPTRINRTKKAFVRQRDNRRRAHRRRGSRSSCP